MAEEFLAEEGRLVSLSEVRAMLEKAQADRQELTYEQKLALEHSQRFGRLSAEKVRELVGELKGLGFINEVYAYKIADLLPEHGDDVKLIFAKSKQTITDDETKKVLETVAKYLLEA